MFSEELAKRPTKGKIATEQQLACNRAITIDNLKFDTLPGKSLALTEPEMRGLFAVQLPVLA